MAGQTQRILLVKPDISDVSIGFTSLARVAPLELLMVAASVPEHERYIVDMRLERPEAFEQIIEEFQPTIVGVTAYSAEAKAAKELARRARAAVPEATVIMGGYHATMATEDALLEPAIDLVVCAEAEETFPELVEALSTGADYREIRGIAYRSAEGVVQTPRRGQIKDLDTLPFPDWSLIARYQSEYYLNVMGTMASVESTRGCPYDCNFCSVWVFNNRRYRKKSPKRVLQELDNLPGSIQVAAFVDDEFWVDDKRALEIAALIGAKAEDWKGKNWRYWAQVRTDDITRTPELVEEWAKVGMRVLLLGIESYKDDEIKELHHKRNTVAHAITALKTIREYGVEAWGCFIVNPEWEEQDFYDLIEFVRHHEIAFPQFTVLTPLPGTVLTNQLAASGQLDLANLQHQLLDFLHAAQTTKLPLRRFYELMAELYEKTSMGANLGTYRRAVRNGVISREWLRSEMGQRVSAFFGQLTKVEAYLKVHQILGQEL